MNLERIGQGAQLAANVGILFSILFLAYQIRETRELTRAQTRNAMAEAAVDLLASEAMNADLASIVYRSYKGEELPGEDMFRLERLMYAYFRVWENAHYQYRLGLYDDSEFRGLREVWRVRLGRPHVAEIWCRVRDGHSPEFVAELEALMPKDACAAASSAG
jgi:hypothetical protein